MHSDGSACTVAVTKHILTTEILPRDPTNKLMIFENLIKPDSVLCNVSARSKKHSIEILSELLSRPNSHISSEEIFSKLIERERLGCTSLEKGIAFPHCRVPGLQKSCAALMKLLEPVDFDSIDGDSVDLVFGLVVPEDLAASDIANIEAITESLRDETLRKHLRDANSSSELYDALVASQVTNTEKIRSVL